MALIVIDITFLNCSQRNSRETLEEQKKKKKEKEKDIE